MSSRRCAASSPAGRPRGRARNAALPPSSSRSFQVLIVARDTPTRRATSACATPRLSSRSVKRKPTDGSTHWSTRKLADRLGISHMTVARVWRKHALRPHRLEGRQHRILAVQRLDGRPLIDAEHRRMLRRMLGTPRPSSSRSSRISSPISRAAKRST